MNPTRCDGSGRVQLIRRASSALVFPSYGQLVADGYDKDRTATTPCFRKKPSERRANAVNGSPPKTPGMGKRLARMNTVADFFRRRRPTSSGVERAYKASPILGSDDVDKDTHASCPSLLAGAAARPSVVKPRVSVTRSCDGGDSRTTRSRRGDGGANSGLVASTLTVPNIFVTSLSRSVDLLTSRGDVATTSERRVTVATRRSAPELAKPATTDVFECFSVMAPPSPPPLLFPVLVHDHLYIASTDVAYNERLLCELNIASVVELDVGAVPSNPRTYRPCLCERRERHRPAVLRLGFSQPPDGAALRSCFDQVNRFIDGARRGATNVLVCGGDHQLHHVVVIQYLTSRCDMLPSRAHSVVMRQSPGMHLSPAYQRLLADLGDRPRNHDVVRPTGGALLPKDAWSDF